MAKKPIDWLQLSQTELNAKASELMGRPNSRLRINPDSDEFEQWLLDSYRDRIIARHEIGEQERPIFRRAAIAYFYGSDVFDRLELQSKPENWDKTAGGEFIRQISEIMFTDRHGREVSVLGTRRRKRPVKYNKRLFALVIAHHYPSLTGKKPKPPLWSKPFHQELPSEFSALCDKWALIIDPNVKLPLFSSKQYRNLLKLRSKKPLTGI